MRLRQFQTLLSFPFVVAITLGYYYCGPNNNDEKPICPSYSETKHNQEYKVLWNSLLTSTTNQSVFPGESLNVTASINNTLKEEHDLTLKLYVNGCGYSLCLEEVDNVSDTYTVKCEIQDIQDQIEIHFLVFSHFNFVCFNVSHIDLRGPPHPVQLLNITLSCNGVFIRVFDIDNGTSLSCEVFARSNSHQIVYNLTTESSDFFIPFDKFHEDANYTVRITSFNQAGFARPVYASILLNNYINFSVSNIQYMSDGGSIYAFIELKTDDSCPLSVPVCITASSDCSVDPVTECSEKAKAKLEGPPTLVLPLVPGKRFCNLVVTSGSRNVTVELNRSTSLVQDAHWTVEGEIISVTCSLLPGSPDTGCAVLVQSLNQNYTENKTLTRQMEEDIIVHGQLGPLPGGSYHILVFDSWGFGQYNRSLFAFEGTFTIGMNFTSSIWIITPSSSQPVPGDEDEPSHDFLSTGWTVALVLGGTVALLLPIVFILSIFVIITTHKRRRSVDFRSDELGDVPGETTTPESKQNEEDGSSLEEQYLTTAEALKSADDVPASNGIRSTALVANIPEITSTSEKESKRKPVEETTSFTTDSVEPVEQPNRPRSLSSKIPTAETLQNKVDLSLTVCLPCPTKDSECIDNGVQTTGSAGGSYVPQQQNLQPPIGVNEDVTGYSMCADLPDQMKDDGGNEQTFVGSSIKPQYTERRTNSMSTGDVDSATALLH